MHRTALLIAAVFAVPACAPARPGAAVADAISSAPRRAGDSLARPVVNPVAPPGEFQRAIARGTRTATGAPGARYWQQWARYDISAKLIVEEKRLEGTTSIVYFNRSPDSLPVLWLELTQNYHAAGGERIEQAEVTGGMRLRAVTINGQRADTTEAGPAYQVDGTRLAVRPAAAVQPGDSTRLTIEWSFVIPQAGASGRMGWSRDDLFYLAYWYPRMAVYDDVVGWQTDTFLGRSEFYHDFGSYTYNVDVPEGWLVMGTGTLENATATLSDSALARMRRAERSDSVVAVVSAADLESNVTRRGRGGRLTWTFRADSVRDVAFSVTRRSLWDAVRTPVGDRNGDGRADHARVDAIYRESAPRWRNVARYARHAIDFLSRYTGFSYPWPHMTAVEGADIIVGGMEYPMMTLIGGYNQQGDSALYYVTAHELGHMWIPMSLSTDERRYSWIDEGFTTFHENQARTEFFPGKNHDEPDREAYVTFARTGREGEMLRWSNFHYTSQAYFIASYQKPASVLAALRGVLGEETFNRALRSLFDQWSFRHPYPWDVFATFEAVSGRDLDWFWRAWYHETWTLDQAVGSVSETADGARIVVEDRGDVPMPARLTVTRADGRVERREIPVATWLGGARTASVMLPAGAPVQRVEIDAAREFPDIDRQNNVWQR